MDRRRYLGTVAAVAAALAGCTGGESGDGNGDVETPTATPTEPGDGEETPADTADDGSPGDGEETAAETETPAGTATPEPPEDPEQRVAVGDGLQFDPESFEISVGDAVLWEWVEGGHNIKYDEGDVPEDTTWEGTRGERTTTYGEGHAHRHTFEAAGEYDYYCVPHRSSGMRASFTVSE